MTKFTIFPLLTTIFSLFFLLTLLQETSHSAFVFQSEESSLELSYNKYYLKTTDNLEGAPTPDSGHGKDSGNLDGVRIVYTHSNKKSQLHYKLFLEQWAGGTTDFEGFNMMSYPQNKTLIPEIMKVENDLKTYELQLGLIFKRGLNKLPFDFTLYTGYGIHIWERKFSGEGNSVKFRQEYTWGYVPVGFKINYNMTSKLSVGLDVAAKLVTRARLRANLNGAAGNGITANTNPGANLGRRVGGRVEIPFIYTTSNSKGWSYIITPWVDIMQTVEKDQMAFDVSLNGTPIGTYTWTEPAIKKIATGMAIGIYKTF